MKRTSAHPFRRTAVVALVAMVAAGAAGVAGLAGPASAQEDFVGGSGRAKTQILNVGPTASQLSLAPSVGVALADHIGSLGRGESLIFDYAALDTAIDNSFPFLKEEFPPLKIGSTAPNSEAGIRWEPKPSIVEDVAATDAPVGRSAVSVGKVLDIPGVIEVEGARARAFSGVYERTDPDTEQTEPIRAAGGTVSIAKIVIGGGELQLHDLRWEGAQVTDRNDDDDVEQLGAFVVGRVVAQGETHDHVTHEELMEIVGPLNEEVLSHLGIRITEPTVDTESGVVTVGPLGIVIASDHLSDLGPHIQEVRGTPVPNDSDEEGEPEEEPLSKNMVDRCQTFEESGEEDDGGEGDGDGSESQGGGTTPGVLGRVDPGATVLAHHGGEHEEFDEFSNDGPRGEREPADFTPPEGADRSNCGLPFLVADLAIAPFTGAGTLRLNFGGVLGFTEGTFFEGFELGGGSGGFGGFGGNGNDGGGFEVSNEPAPAPEPAPAQTTGFDAGGTAATPSTTPSSQPPATSAPPTDANQQAAGQQQPRIIELSSSAESAMWALGLLGLAAASAMAASDYRRLRSRRRSVNPIS